MSFINDLFKPTPNLSTVSKYTVFNGFVYLGIGGLLVVWPGVTQTIFRDAAFVGHEEGLMRAGGLGLVVIGWLYLSGGRTDSRAFTGAAIVDRLVFVPIVLVPLAVAGVFPHLLLTQAILDPLLAIGAWVLISRDRG
jgi:hypothetical protein